MHHRFDLNGRTALVTGASSGLGSHFAQVLAENGARIILGARRFAEIEKAAIKLSASGYSATAYPLDVTDPLSVNALFAKERKIDIIINNAGISLPGDAISQSMDEIDAMIDVNIRGMMRVSRAGAQNLIDRQAAGAIVNVASILGMRQAGHVTGYAMTKAAVIQLTKQYALELSRYNIAVNGLAPGYFETPLNADFLASDAGAALKRRIPQRRFGSMSDLDVPLLLLASSAGTYMTGNIIAVDGGHSVSTL
jgi:NAD(P)-dependent dehydrogenase (short-subunit alcohol dehydrogenase family)